MTYLPGADYFVYYASLPLTVRGMVSTNADGTYTIILNDRLPESKQRAAYFHEVDHITGDDFYNGLPIERVENL